MKILVIDDDNVTLSIFARVFEKYKMECTTVNSGTSGINAYENGNFDVIILDNGLPDIKGTEVYEIIRKTNKDIKILLSSGGLAFADIIKLNKNNYELNKPFSIKTLLEIINS